MVSTRQCSMKFSIGETVLCYEPDTTKAKVLYESKVLEVDLTKDEKGRKIPEYFVHFSGWNKSWDRWVVEDQVLEGNEANRLRMKKLHEEAINCLKSKKKRKDLSISESSQSPIASEALSVTTQQQPVSPAPSSPLLSFIELEIPSSLKLKLEDDCYFIKRKKKLVRLPRSPNVREILKEYLDYITEQETQEANSSLNIVKEVIDGVRIYFDFTLYSLLLYNFERGQYDEVVSQNTRLEKTKCGENSKVKKVVQKNTEGGEKDASQEYAIKTRKSSTASEASKGNPNQDNQSSDRVLRRRSKRQKVSTSVGSSTSNSPTISSSGCERDDSLNSSFDMKMNEETNHKGIKRKLKEAVTKENRVKSTSKESKTSPDTKNQHSSSLCDPSMIYGAEHLLRLFVKLPSLLAKTTIQQHRLSLLMQHLTDFLKYLSSRTNILFSEDAYEDIIL